MGGDNLAVTAAGLPDITGDVGIHGWALAPTGAFQVSSNMGQAAYIENERTHTIDFAASRSNAIYGASNTVTPPNFSLLPQIKY